MNPVSTITENVYSQQSYSTLVAHQAPMNVQGQQTQGYAGSDVKGNANGIGVIQNTGNCTANQSKVIRCYNYKAQEAGVALNEEQLIFLADTRERVDSGTDARTLTTTTIFQSYDINAFDSDCDEAHAAQATFMANLSAYGSDVLSEVPNYDTYHDNTC
ncbi:hypothetical protein Tco_0265314 [Tanacetum coccineum]